MAFSFAAHVALFTRFLDRRPQILEAIETRLLNVQGKEVSRAANRREFEQILSSCFVSVRGKMRSSPTFPPRRSRCYG